MRFQNAAKTFEAELGLGHPDTLDALYSLADALRKLGKCGEADTFSQRAREGEKQLDPASAMAQRKISHRRSKKKKT
jgi:hypothetical protein